MTHHTRRKHHLPQNRVLAAPSWVIPGTLAENCRFLAGHVDEASLLFFETSSCLRYGDEDIPPELADLPLTYHMHLPLDLPWRTPETAARICCGLLQKTRRLTAGDVNGPQGNPPHLRAVLHPPRAADEKTDAESVRAFARAFTNAGGCPSLLFLENIQGNDLVHLEPVLNEFDMGICLDVGHMFAYGQIRLAGRKSLLKRAGIVHLSAPGTGATSGKHLPLTVLGPGERRLCKRLLRKIPEQAVIMIELFHWQDILDSLPLVRSWLLPEA